MLENLTLQKVILNGLEFKRLKIEKTSWNIIAFAPESGNESYQMKRMDWVEKYYKEKITKLCE